MRQHTESIHSLNRSFLYKALKNGGKILALSLINLLFSFCGGGGNSSDSPPQAQVTVSNNPSPGYVYLTETPSRFIVNVNMKGGVTFSRKVIEGDAFDFKIQPNGAKSFYTLTSGTPGSPNYSADGFLTAMDSNYQVTGKFVVPGGPTDLHDSMMLPNGHVIMLSYQDTVMDLTAYGGNAAAIVTDIQIEEIDSSGAKVFEWRGRDHFQIGEAASDIDLQRAPPNKIDYAHGNSIDMDNNGNLLLSCRHLDTVVKIDHQTGEIIWRLGGKKSDFVFSNDSLNGPSHQNCARFLPIGNLILFDNGNLHNPPLTRAIEYQLNETATPKTATLVWQFVNNPPSFSPAEGSVQRLDNGNTFIGWGFSSNPAATEVMPDGTKVFEMAFPAGITSYRAFKFDR
jgi:hypothetical protein